MRNPIVIGERVYLRPLETSDAETLSQGKHDETETFFESGRWMASPIAFAQWIEEMHAHQPPDEVQLAICLIEDDTLIGYTGFSNLDLINRTAETEIYISSPAHREQGFGTEAKHLLLEYCFDRLHLEAVSSFIWEPNERSVAAVLRQGYRTAGRIKTMVPQGGFFRDVLVFDLMRDEWLEARDAWRKRRSGG